jgi:hypothetical protein
MPINPRPLAERPGAQGDRAAADCAPDVGGIRLYPQPVQDLTVDDRVSRSSSTRWSTPTAASQRTAPQVVDAFRALPEVGREQRPAKRRPGRACRRLRDRRRARRGPETIDDNPMTPSASVRFDQISRSSTSTA